MNEFYLGIIAVLLAAIGYFIKRILDKTETIGDDVSEIKPKVDILWKDKYAPAHSPRQLNDRGKNILKDSGIKEIIESKKQKLFDAVKALKPTNAYDAEQMIFSVVNDLPKHCPEVVEDLKNGAFKVGQNVDTVLFVGGIHLRDLVFSDLGFSLTDLDKPKVL